MASEPKGQLVGWIIVSRWWKGDAKWELVYPQIMTRKEAGERLATHAKAAGGGWQYKRARVVLED